MRSRVVSSGTQSAIAIEVADTGIGIEPAQLSRVFEAFEQGDRKITRQFGGLGLGLAISKAIAECHGGQLTAFSEGVGRGSAFTLTLPTSDAARSVADPSRTRRAVALKGQPGVTRPLRILLIEDHVDTATILARLLSRMGHEVVHSATVKGALRAAEDETPGNRFDLVISDLGLPDGSGLDLMSEISARYAVPGIALSGFGMDTDREQSKAAGFAYHLVKPVDIEALRQAIVELTRAM